MSKLDSYHYHELMDRTHLMLSHLEQDILSHPVSKKHKKIRKELKKAAKHLAEAYQVSGGVEHEKFGDEFINELRCKNLKRK